MRFPRDRFLRLSAAIVMFVCAGFSGTIRGQDDMEIPGEFFDHVSLPDGIRKAQYRDAVVGVLKEREWTVLEQSDWRIVAHMKKLPGGSPLGFLNQRGNEATVTLVFAGETIDLYCEGWVLDKDGERTRQEIPKSWLGRLQKDLADRFEAIAAGGQ